jgi:GNAT superfamily N-acetyltransferase
MDAVRTLLDRLRGRPHPEPVVRPIAPIPPVIAERLCRDNEDLPLFPQLRQYGRGRPGVTQEAGEHWVVRDERGRVVGGAKVGWVGPDHPVALDVAVDPSRQGEGWATLLYEALEEAGIDAEAGSAASLAHRQMTRDGYAFMRARRLRKDPDAEAKIVATANVCPGCGSM